MKEQIKIEDTKLKQFIGNEIFEKALSVARKCHINDVRRDGDPYINHVIRVAERVADINENYVAVALLHDTVEDKHITLDDLNLYGFNKDIIRAIDDLSRRKDQGESYFDFIMRVMASENPYSKIVKIADLNDNMIGNKEGSQLDKYRLATYILWNCGQT